MSEINSKAAKGANKPRGKPFAQGKDDRRHTEGTKSTAVILFHRTLRETIATVGNEMAKVGEEGKEVELSRIEIAVRGLYTRAAAGDVQAFNALVERVEGKVPSGDDFALQERLNKIINEFLLKLTPIYGAQRASEIVGHLAKSDGFDTPNGGAGSESAT